MAGRHLARLQELGDASGHRLGFYHLWVSQYGDIVKERVSVGYHWRQLYYRVVVIFVHPKAQIPERFS
jgi:hypothetical protein